MDELKSLQSLGFEWPTPSYLFGSLVFGILGYAAWRAGKRQGRPRTRWLGLALMLYPYLVSSTWVLYATGAALCAGVMLDRD